MTTVHDQARPGLTPPGLTAFPVLLLLTDIPCPSDPRALSKLTVKRFCYSPAKSLDYFDSPEHLVKWLDDVPAEELPAVQACLMAQADQRQQLHADRISRPGTPEAATAK
ncbi:hypothetical protein [Nonomuraea sp. NPDC049709]|uniref:hypothetical protein n=1 Tax=Nonomuraea sp. NPDC049709 TaxID=3154736 RepID=UPI003431BEC4